MSGLGGSFELLARDPGSLARRGRLHTRRGVVETPIFMPVGTQGTVKAVSPRELHELEAQIILGNTYHLFVRPGLEVLRHLGGLHRFMHWDRPILTDSGGFQVFSLARLRRIREEGVYFQNHLDGTPCFIGPETSMEIQEVLGSDIVMAFDECPPHPCPHEQAAASLERTLQWERRSLDWWDRRGSASGARPLLFGIVQGSSHQDLRRRSAEQLVAMGWDGYAIGGVSVGEPEPEMMRAVEHAVPHLPEDRPRYAMGLGTPPQMVEMVARGVDMFDCVLPTRLARNGTAFTAGGTINLKNAAYTMDEGPVEAGCSCYCCANFSRSYLRHLVKAEEILGLRLVTLHNLHFYLGLMKRVRSELEGGTFDGFRREFVSGYRVHRPEAGA